MLLVLQPYCQQLGVGAGLSCLGKLSPLNAAPCVQLCRTGTFSSTPGSATCTSCAAGTYANTTGSTGCTDCPLGTAAPSNGTVTCGVSGVRWRGLNDGAVTCLHDLVLLLLALHTVPHLLRRC